MILKEYLLAQGFEQKLEYQFHGDSYIVILLRDTDSYGFEIWGIINKRFEETVFKGRIMSVVQFLKVFSFVKEDYDLSEDEREELSNIL